MATAGHPAATARRVEQAWQGARADMRRELRTVQRTRALTLGVVVLALLAAVPLFFAIRAAARDPVFADLDALQVPSWAERAHQDEASGSRWCIRQCRFRERTWESTRGPEETAAAYERALRSAGWRKWTAPGCPAVGIDGIDSCWQRDEYVLDLWTRQPQCASRPVRPTVGPTGTSPSEPAASGAPAVPPGPAPDAGNCPAAVVTAKVFNLISLPTGG